MLIENLQIRGLLSFRDTSLEMRSLNVLIGPNASGKSNLIEIMALLRGLPRDLPDFFLRSGETSDWFWKGNPVAGNGVRSDGSINVELVNPLGGNLLRLVVGLSQRSQFLHIDEERLEYAQPGYGHREPYWFFNVTDRHGRIKVRPTDDGERAEPDIADGDSDRANPTIGPDDLPPGQSVLRERRDSTLYPQVTAVARSLDAIRLFREWNMGRASSVRDAARTDGPSDFLSEDFSNLALVLNNLQNGPAFETVESNLNRFYESYERILVNIQASRAELMIREKGLSSAVPATRLSDGTLRFLALMAILCHPEPPPLVCIEEPELGLHPDIIPIIAELLETASQRTQLVITTHSAKLINALSNAPESVVICTLDPGEGTQLERLSSEQLAPWLERFELGELWEMGEIGGNRW